MPNLRLLVFAVAILPSWSAAQTPPPKPDAKPEPAKQETPKRDPKAEEYEKAVKDLKRIEGAWTLYQRKREILLELPESRLGQLFCLQATLHSGVTGDGLQAGFPLSADVPIDAFRFERNEDNVWLVKPALKNRFDPVSALAEASRRSFPNAILGSYRIEQSHPEKKLLLLNVTPIFLGEPIRLSDSVNSALGAGYMLDREKSFAEALRGFPENSVVRMSLHFLSQRGGGEPSGLAALLGLGGSTNLLEDGRSAPLKVTYSVWWRRETGYQARFSDPRVGYFTLDFFSVDRFARDDRTERLIHRFDLRKKDPTAKLSEPIKPIVWTLDPSIPEDMREACREGVLMWNEAFEAAGFKNAIQVQDAPKDPEWDHADGRYNVIRWAMSRQDTFAVALMRADPITGEVLNAGVNVDANMVTAAFQEQERIVVPGQSAFKRALEILTHDTERDATWTPDRYLFDYESERERRARNQALHAIGAHPRDCTCAQGKAESARFAWSAMQAAGKVPISRAQFAHQFMREIIAHEVGHCLGLRHNFLSSAWLSPEQLGDRATTNRLGTTASVMEYTPVNISAVLRGGGNYYTPKVGPYDVWAIRYGYTQFPGNPSSHGERAQLSQLANRRGDPALRYMTDEDADGFNPFVVRFDNSSDPIGYSERVLLASRNIRKFAQEKMPLPGQSYALRTQVLLREIRRTFGEGRTMARFVGGVVNNRDLPGDLAPQPVRAVPAATQRRAMRLISKHCLAATALQLPPELVRSMGQDFNQAGSSSWTAPVREVVGTQQAMLVSMLMSATVTRRIAENELKAEGEPYTLAEHYGHLLAAVYGDLNAQKLPPLRRDLQRFAATALISQAGALPGGVIEDVRTLAADSITRVEAQLAALEKTPSPDRMTQAHRRELRATLRRFLSRQRVEG